MFKGSRRWKSQLEQENGLSLLLFVLFRPSKDWTIPTRLGRSDLSLFKC